MMEMENIWININSLVRLVKKNGKCTIANIKRER